jgi:hypothetical protein
MSFEITERTRQLAEAQVKEPLLILEIEGLDTILTSKAAFRTLRYGDDNIFYGDPGLVYGGRVKIEDQEPIVSFGANNQGTSTSINQQLDIDKGRGSSVSSITVALIDFRGIASRLISPGVELNEILAKRCRLWYGFEGGSFPEDFIILFRGIIDDVDSGAGLVKINIAHPDQKKRQQLFNIGESETTLSINSSQTTITVTDTSSFLDPANSNDPSLRYYIQIEDEIIEYESKTATEFLNCTRGALATTATNHDVESNVTSVYRLTGNCIDLALKLMLSGLNDFYVKDLKISDFNKVDQNTIFQDAILFQNQDLQRLFNIQIGDLVTIEDAINPANNLVDEPITAINFDQEVGTVLFFQNTNLVNEFETDAKIFIKSKYDTLGEGLALLPDEVDIAEHERIKSNFLSSFEYDFYLKEEINCKEFLEKEIYLPYGCYSLPRKAQASLGILAPPVPGGDLVVLDSSNIIRPSSIKIKRSLNKNFINTLVYKFDELPLEEKFLRNVVRTDVDSRDRIKVGTKALIVESKGMRAALNGVQNATLSTQRRLDRYKFAAEFFEGVQVLLGDTFNVEIGDIVVVDFSNLEITDFQTGERDKPPALFEIINKSMNLKTGEIKLDLLNTGFNPDFVARYALISPSSIIGQVFANNRFELAPSFSNPFGTDEGRKWRRYQDNLNVVIRSQDSTIIESAKVRRIDFNTVTLENDLSFTPQVGMIFELDSYNEIDNDVLKLLYASMTDNPTFDDDKEPYLMS